MESLCGWGGMCCTDPGGNQLELRDHCCVNKVSIYHQSDLDGVRCEGQDVRKCTD